MSSATSLASSLANGLRKLVGAGAQQPRSYRLINVELKQRIDLSPSMTRLVFGGEDIAQARTLAPDQRIKLLFPGADGTPAQLPVDGDWQAARRQLPAEQQPPMRTYTIRALRMQPAEMDVDFVLHGVNGPASAWATHAQWAARAAGLLAIVGVALLRRQAPPAPRAGAPGPGPAPGIAAGVRGYRAAIAVAGAGRTGP